MHLDSIGKTSLSEAVDPLMLDSDAKFLSLPVTLTDSELHDTVYGITTYIESVANFERTDRLWPASPQVFYTNPLGYDSGRVALPPTSSELFEN